MRTYYRGPDAVVTDQLFVWQTATTKAFVLAELRDVGRERRDGSRLRPVLAAGLLAVSGAGWVELELPGTWYVGIGALVVALVVAGWPPRAHSWALTAAYRDQDGVTLYRSSDPRVFHQVTRALQRALEDIPRPR